MQATRSHAQVVPVITASSNFHSHPHGSVSSQPSFSPKRWMMFKNVSSSNYAVAKHNSFVEGEFNRFGRSRNSQRQQQRRRKHVVEAVASPPSTEGLALTEENVEMVLDEVRPYLMSDGGNVELYDIDGLVVKLKLQGACGSCPSSLMTMKMGIERRLMETINVAISIATKIVIFVLTGVGLAYLWMAVLTDVGTGMLVTFNSMLLLRGAKRYGHVVCNRQDCDDGSHCHKDNDCDDGGHCHKDNDGDVYYHVHGGGNRHQVHRNIETSTSADCTHTVQEADTCGVVKCSACNFPSSIHHGCAKPRTSRCCQNSYPPQVDLCASGNCRGAKRQLGSSHINDSRFEQRCSSSNNCCKSDKLGNSQMINGSSSSNCCNSSKQTGQCTQSNDYEAHEIVVEVGCQEHD